jgi:hypothetical protein
LCLQELEALVRRAAVQVSQAESKDAEPGSSSAKRTQPASGGFAGYGVEPKKGGVFALDKDVFWFAKAVKDRFRWNLLNPLPLLRQVRWATPCGCGIAAVVQWQYITLLWHFAACSSLIWGGGWVQNRWWHIPPLCLWWAMDKPNQDVYLDANAAKMKFGTFWCF